MNNRYDRQQQVFASESGTQKQLEQAAVLIVGLGGLGCPAAQYLAGAGIGNLGLADGDMIDISNLHRQVLFRESEVGQNKAIAAARSLALLNGTIRYTTYPYFLNEENLDALVMDYDLILDATDNPLFRYTLSDACARRRKPYLFAANYQLEGQWGLLTFPEGKNSLRQWYSNQIPTQNCTTAGAIGPILGMIGSLMAWETLRFLTGIKNQPINVLHYINYKNYDTLQFFGGQEVKENCEAREKENSTTDIEAAEFHRYVMANNRILVDVREKGEQPVVSFLHRHIPVKELRNRIEELEGLEEVVLFCHSGIRTATAMEWLQDEFGMTNITHLKGGLVKYQAYLDGLQE
jgi:molybdopterin/thiamine biosynthesis adenylyltransferase/rhodanese-related sulfurtransferase